MLCSFTELKNLVFNSGVGSKIEIGICEEISEAVAKLELYGFNASNEILSCFQNIAPRNNKIQFSNKLIKFGNSQVIFEGLSGIDYFRTGLYNEILFEKLDSPLILIGLALINNVQNFKVINESSIIGYVDNDKFFCNEDLNGSYSNIFVKKEKMLPIKFNSSKNQINLDPNAWNQLENISKKILVPESTISRNLGAGAGTTDND